MQLLSDVSELLRLSQRLKLLERLILDLPDPLTGDVERPTNLIEGARMLAAKPVAQLKHATLAVAEVLKRLAQGLLGEDLRCALVRGLGALIGDELTEFRFFLVTDRLLERDRAPVPSA